MNITTLFSTTKRVRILDHLLKHPSEPINMNRLAKKLGMSAGLIHKYVTILREEGIVSGNLLVESPVVHSLRLLLNLKRIEESNVLGKLRKHFKKAKGIGIYGSWAKGTNKEDADLDVIIRTAIEQEDITVAKARKELSQAIGAPVDIVIATPERLKHFREKSDAFYFSLYNSITLWGEGL